MSLFKEILEYLLIFNTKNTKQKFVSFKTFDSILVKLILIKIIKKINYDYLFVTKFSQFLKLALPFLGCHMHVFR